MYHANVKPGSGHPASLIVLTSILHLACGTARSSSAPPAYHFTQDWFVGKVSWPDLLREYRDKPDIRYLEIGVFEGRSLFWMLDNILTGNGASAVAVDLFEPSYEGTFLENLRVSGKASRVRILKGRSDSVLHTLPVNSFDIVFIDGSHAARDVLTDAVQGWLLLADHGLMILDDYGNEKPRDEFLSLSRVPDELKPRVAIDAFITAFRGEARYRAARLSTRGQEARAGLPRLGLFHRPELVLRLGAAAAFQEKNPRAHPAYGRTAA